MKSKAQNASRAVLVCFAVKEEARPFLKTMSSKRVQVLITGMGSKNAEESLRKTFQNYLPELVLTCGFAGGLKPELAAGKIVFSADQNFPFISHLVSSGAKAGTFHCAQRVVISAGEKSKLRMRTQADAVEMESEVIRRICAERGIPSATIRVISDSANEDLPLDFNQLMSADDKLSFTKLALAIAFMPWKIPALIRLGRTTKQAAENLGRILESLPI